MLSKQTYSFKLTYLKLHTHRSAWEACHVVFCAARSAYLNPVYLARAFKMSFEDIIIEIQNKLVLWMSVDPNYNNGVMKAKLWRELTTKLGIQRQFLYMLGFLKLGLHDAWYVFVVRHVWMCLKRFVESDTYSLLWCVNLPPNWRTRCDEWTNDTSTQIRHTFSCTRCANHDAWHITNTNHASCGPSFSSMIKMEQRSSLQCCKTTWKWFMRIRPKVGGNVLRTFPHLLQTHHSYMGMVIESLHSTTHSARLSFEAPLGIFSRAPWIFSEFLWGFSAIFL